MRSGADGRNQRQGRKRGDARRRPEGGVEGARWARGAAHGAGWGGASGRARRRPRAEGLVGSSGCALPQTGAAHGCVKGAGLWN